MRVTATYASSSITGCNHGYMLFTARSMRHGAIAFIATIARFLSELLIMLRWKQCVFCGCRNCESYDVPIM